MPLNPETPEAAAKLWVVATPLGNLGDLSPRAREILSRAGLILAEDTRRAGLFFKRAGIEAAGRFESFFEHNEEQRIPFVLRKLEAGLEVALISDAGTPLVSDPGFRLVRAAREAGFAVSPLPGPCAASAALSASGLPPVPHVFLGFLPRKSGEISALFKRLAPLAATLVFFERKDRLSVSLMLAREVFGGGSHCVICREMTKEHEEFIGASLDELCARQLDLLGEITVVLSPDAQAVTSETEVLKLLASASGQGGRPKDVARQVAEITKGWTAKRLYEMLMKLGNP